MTDSIQIRLLGTPSVRNARGVVTLGARAQALLYYLAATAQRGAASQTRSALAGMFWGESDDDLARTSLRKTLVDLRKVLGEQLESDYQTVTFHTDGCWIDLLEFTQSTQQAATLDLAQLQTALNLYQGDFLAGFFLRNAPDYENWLLTQRTYYRSLALQGLQTLATRQAQSGDLEPAIQGMRRLLVLEPWHEEAHQALMRWLAQSGQRSAALAQFDHCRRQLAEELAVEPSAETVALYEEIRTGRLDKVTRRQSDKETSISPVTLSPPHLVTLSSPHTLPAQPTPFIGRQQEVADLLQRLADPTCRLLTLVGPGGMGKTRLALEVAKQSGALSANKHDAPDTSHHAPFPDGIFFVPLAAVSTPSALVAALAEATTFTFYSNVPPRQQLVSHLADKKLLLLLDNFEHLLAGVDLVSEILATAPGVKLLVTSREVLNLQEEWLYPVAGLTLPALNSQYDAALVAIDAMRLFVQCAQRARPSFDLAAEWRCVVRICRLVDGMPLGIELASTWLRTLPCTQIAEEIQRNLDFLTTRLHNLPERHRSMRAVFEYSWQLLTPEEQMVLRRLAILRGFCQEAASEVANASLFTVTMLAEKSLLQVLRSTGHGRYALHELLRQFLEEKLQADSAEQTTLRTRHSAYYLTRLAEEARALNGSDERAALTTLGEELENIRLAWLWAAKQGQLEQLGQHLDELSDFYTYSHRYQEGIELFEATLQELTQTNADSEDWIVRKLLNRLGGFYTNLGRFERAQILLTTGLALSQALGITIESAFCLHLLGEVAGWQGNFAEGQRHLEEGLALSRSVGSQAQVAQILVSLTEFRMGLGDHIGASKLCEESLRISRQLDHKRFMLASLRQLAFSLFMSGNYGAAAIHAREGLLLAEAMADNLQLLLLRILHIRNATVLGEITAAEAIALGEKSLTHLRGSGQRYYVAASLYFLGQALSDLATPDAAQHYCQEGIALAKGVHAAVATAGCLAVQGDLHRQSGNFRVSRQTLTEALQLTTKSRALPLTIEVILYFSTLLAAESKAAIADQAQATAKRAQAVELLVWVGQHPACWQLFKDRATHLLAELRNELPPTIFAAAQARGQQLALEEVVATLLMGQ